MRLVDRRSKDLNLSMHFAKANMLLFNFASAEVVQLVLNGGPYTFDHHPFVTKRMTPFYKRKY